MTDRTPCSANPDQWYTERDGRRYDDEPLVSDEQIRAIAVQFPPHDIAGVEEAVDVAVAEATKQRLIERRQAREGCFACPARLACLDLALKRREQYGIWGGYFPEQRRAIERELDRRETERRVAEEGDAAGE